MRIAHRVVPGLLAGSLLLGGASGVFAAKAGTKAHRAHLAVAAGQVSGLQSTGAFTVTFTPKKANAATKTWQVSVTATTKTHAAKGATGALQNGEYAIVIGRKSTTGITARSIRYAVTPFKARQVALVRLHVRLAALTAARVHRLRGAVSATQTAGTLSVMVTTKKGVVTRTFTITPTTKYFVGKTAATSAPAFTSGEKVIVRFKRDKATKTFNALAIRVAASA